MTRDKMSPTTACLDVLRPLLGNDMHPTHPIASRRGGAVAADALQHCAGRSVAQTSQQQHLVGLSQRTRGVHAASRQSVPCPPRSTELGCLRWLLRRSFRRASYIRGRRKADLRRAVVDVRHLLPGDARADSESRSERDPPVSAGRTLRARRSKYCMHGTIDRRRCRWYALHVTGRRSGLPRRYRLFARREDLRVARQPTSAGQEQPCGFLRTATSRARGCRRLTLPDFLQPATWLPCAQGSNFAEKSVISNMK